MSGRLMFERLRHWQCWTVEARRWYIGGLVLLLLCAPLVLANDIRINDARLIAAEDGGYSLSADLDVQLSRRLESALSQGVPLYFTLSFECYRPRWYWFDARVSRKTHQSRLSFHALTRTYRLSTGPLHQTFETLADAVHALGTVRGWHVINADDLEPEQSYEVVIRMALDVDQLPKPFQVSALTNRDWTLASEWERWGFSTDAQGRIAQ